MSGIDSAQARASRSVIDEPVTRNSMVSRQGTPDLWDASMAMIASIIALR
jgi:hypothetical protein